MGLDYILRKVASGDGVSSPDLNSAQRAALLDIINEAAEEVWESRDLPGSLREFFVRVTPDYEMVLPAFVGELRAVRSCTENYNDWRLVDMRPRYNRMEWLNKWKNWRIKGTFPIQTEITNTAPGTITYSVLDTALIVTIVGETSDSNRAIDNISMDAVSKDWTKNFTSIKRIFKNKITDYNVILLDADGNEMALIYADQLEAKYQVVDVSAYPNIGSCNCQCPDGSIIMEVLYKQKLPRMEKDEDSFPVDGYDNVIVLKARQLIAEDEEKGQKALLMYEKGEGVVKRKIENVEGVVQKKLKFKRRSFYGQFRTSHCNTIKYC